MEEQRTSMDLLRLLFENVVFFFSSRRRHTSCGRDWSSDVCSSDLDCTGVCNVARALLPAAPALMPALVPLASMSASPPSIPHRHPLHPIHQDRKSVV